MEVVTRGGATVNDYNHEGWKMLAGGIMPRVEYENRDQVVMSRLTLQNFYSFVKRLQVESSFVLLVTIQKFFEFCKDLPKI
jgi:hypothetical protein